MFKLNFKLVSIRSNSHMQVENGEAKFQALVDCNISSMLAVTRAVLPSMVARGRGAVINMSSYSAHCGPLLAVYAASKAFVIQFSSDLEMEYREKGVTIMCAAPYYVVSNMSKIRRASLTTPTATVYAASVLGQLGTTAFTYGYWAHDLVAFAIRWEHMKSGETNGSIFSSYKSETL